MYLSTSVMLLFNALQFVCLPLSMLNSNRSGLSYPRISAHIQACVISGIFSDLIAWSERLLCPFVNIDQNRHVEKDRN